MHFLAAVDDGDACVLDAAVAVAAAAAVVAFAVLAVCHCYTHYLQITHTCDSQHAVMIHI
jgi:hypothetical protein